MMMREKQKLLFLLKYSHEKTKLALLVAWSAMTS